MLRAFPKALRTLEASITSDSVSAQQVKAAQIIVDKCVPNLQAVKHDGEIELVIDHKVEFKI